MQENCHLAGWKSLFLHLYVRQLDWRWLIRSLGWVSARVPSALSLVPENKHGQCQGGAALGRAHSKDSCVPLL